MAIYDASGNEITFDGGFYETEDNSVNVLDLSTTTPSGSDAEEWASTASVAVICDYIAVDTGGFTIVANEPHRPWSGYIYTYDSNKTFLEKIQLSSTTLDNSYYAYVYVPNSDVAYIRFQYYTSTLQSTSVLKLYNKIIQSSDDFLDYSFSVSARRIRMLLGIENIDSPFAGKKVICLGDSITENNTHNGNYSWCMYLKDVFGMKVYNNGKSGTGLIKGYGGFRSICNRVDLGLNDYPTDITPDYVLIMGNGNDATGGAYYDYTATSTTVTNEHGASSLPVGTSSDTSSTLSVYGAMKHLLEALIAKYPLAKIGFITSTPRLQDLTSYWGADKANFYGHGAFEDYVTAIKWVCAEYNVPCLDLYHNTVLRPWNPTNANYFYADSQIHPNSIGTFEGMVKPICRWMLDSF